MSCVYKREKTVVDEDLFSLPACSSSLGLLSLSEISLSSVFSDVMRSRSKEEIFAFSLFFTLGSFLFSLLSFSLPFFLSYFLLLFLSSCLQLSCFLLSPSSLLLFLEFQLLALLQEGKTERKKARMKVRSTSLFSRRNGRRRLSRSFFSADTHFSLEIVSPLCVDRPTSPEVYIHPRRKASIPSPRHPQSSLLMNLLGL